MARTVTGESAGVFGSYTSMQIPQAGIGTSFGVYAQPAVPLSLTAVTNPAPVAATVTVTSGTGTNVSVNGVLQGTFDGSYTVPVNGTIALTYTVAPSWTWSWPAIPASTVTAANNLPVAATVTVAGGTGTNVAINGVLQGTFAGSYTVPPNGGTIALTYSGIPSWAWSWPVIPASGVAAVNPSTQPVQVVVIGGTISNVSVNGVTVTGGTYTVPGLGSIAITYSGIPSWAWSVPASFLAAKNADGSPVAVTGVN
jgi:hypothetical protein